MKRDELAQHISKNPTAGVTGFYAENSVDDTMCKGFLDCLHRYYPGWSWFVESRGGVIIIRNFELSRHWSMVLHKDRLDENAYSARRKLLHAAGEFLERAKQARAKRDLDAPTASPFKDLFIEGANKMNAGDKGEVS